MAFSLTNLSPSTRSAMSSGWKIGQSTAATQRPVSSMSGSNTQAAVNAAIAGSVAGVDRSAAGVSRVHTVDPMSAVQGVLGQINHSAHISRVGGGSSQPYRALDPLQGALGRADPVMSYNWFCQMPTLNSASIPWNYIEAATLPFRNYNTNSIYRDGKQHNFVQMYGVDNLNVTFYLDQANVALGFLTAWDSIISPYVGRQNLVSHGATYYLPAVYAKDIIFYLLDSARQSIVTITYVGCYPINIGTLGLTSGTSDALTADVQFNVNDIAIDVFSVDRHTFSTVNKNISNTTQQAPNIGVPRPVIY